MSVNRIALLFRELFDVYLKSANINGLFLLAKADANKIDKLLSEGVSSIEMNFFGYKETFEYAKRQGKVDNAGFLSPFLDYLNSDTDPSDDMDRMNTRIIIKPGKNWAVPSIKDHLNHVASAAIDNVSETGEVTIVTKTNIKIKSSELMVSQKVDIKGNKRVLDVQDAFNKIERAHANLKHNDLLSE